MMNLFTKRFYFLRLKQISGESVAIYEITDCLIFWEKVYTRVLSSQSLYKVESPDTDIVFSFLLTLWFTSTFEVDILISQ